MARKLVSSGSPFESIIGFSRAVKMRQVIVIDGAYLRDFRPITAVVQTSRFIARNGCWK